MRESAGKVLLASDNEWFTEALTAVLRTHLYGLEIDVARDREEIPASVQRRRPNLVIVDDRLAREEGTAALCREMVDETLDAAVPVLLYISGGANPGLEAEALRAGAWGVLQEPLRSEVLTAKVDRFLAAEAMSRRRRIASCIDEETGLFELPCLLEALPVMASLARRRRSPVSCTVVGPTTRESGDVPAEEQRRRTARVCVENVRASDLRGWADGGDVAIVALDAPAEGAEVLVERLNALIRREHADDGAYPLSAGIVELEPGAGTDRPRAEGERPEAEAGRGADRVAAGIEPAEALAAARSALAEARAAGGGIRVAAVA